MSLGDIFSDSIRYPFSDITAFLFAGVMALLANMTNIVQAFEIDGGAVTALAAVISFIFALILSGYGISVIRKGIAESDDLPEIDLKNNLIDGIKSLIISIVYYIIPVIIVVIFAVLTGAIGASVDHLLAALGIFAVLAIILFIAFAIFEMIALARFANSGDLGDALSIGEVIDDVNRIGILNIIIFIIIALVIVIVASFIASVLAIIPYIGIIIASVLIGAFTILFYNKALGLLYGSA